jgi:hypothetical protein
VRAQVVEKFVLKIIQLHETMVVRHGIMLVGLTSVGKTSVCAFCLRVSSFELGV